MGLDTSPKKFAQDVAAGLVSINRATLKRYSLPEIRKMIEGLQTVAKEIRSEAIDSGDYAALKEKGMKSQKLNGAMLVIRAYAKENKFTV